jgi:transposase
MNVSDDITAKLRFSRCRAVLEAKLFADAGTKQGYRRQIEPDWASIHRELKRKHLTLSILWDEYVEACPPRFGTARRSASSGALQTRRTSPMSRATAEEEYPQQRSFQVALRAAPKTQAGRPGWS